jgi:hypothetical protein
MSEGVESERGRRFGLRDAFLTQVYRSDQRAARERARRSVKARKRARRVDRARGMGRAGQYCAEIATKFGLWCSEGASHAA